MWLGKFMGKGFVVIVFLAAFIGCAITGVEETAEVDVETLLSGTAIFKTSVSSSEVADVNLLEVDEEMRQFVVDALDGAHDTPTRTRRLLRAMIKAGFFQLNYDPLRTSNSLDTFYNHEGNCLSFTNLFVALAREAGIEANFQIVDIPPVWVSDTDFVVLSNHINVVLKGTFRKDQVVDFNLEEYNGNYDTQEVTDEFAYAYFYSNLGVGALRKQDLRTAFAYFKKALEKTGDIASIWVNLGVLYVHAGNLELAEQAYFRALNVATNNKSALTNLTRLHERLGQEEEAEFYRKRIRRYQNRNPYYHYWLAGAAFDQADYATALSKINKALRMKPDEHQFYFLKAQTEMKTGDRVKAIENLRKAEIFSTHARIRKKYTGKLALLQE